MTGSEQTAQLICIFVFAYAKSRFSHNKAHLKCSYVSNNINKCMTSLHLISYSDLSFLATANEHPIDLTNN